MQDESFVKLIEAFISLMKSNLYTLDIVEEKAALHQNVTPKQAEYFYQKTGKKLNPKLIQDVEPYEWVRGDTEEMYMEICNTQDLHGTIRKWRGEQGSLF